MVEFTPSKKTVKDFNNGIEYINGEDGVTGDAVQAETINSLVESQLWTQALATNQPDIIEANRVGIATATIITELDGTPKIKFSNLKGATGESGIMVPTSGFFSIWMNNITGELFCDYIGEDNPPQFEINSLTGEIFVTI